MNPWIISVPGESRLGPGEVIYIRWEQKNGDYWSEIVLNKEPCRVVLNKRRAEFVEGTGVRTSNRTFCLVGLSLVTRFLHKENPKWKTLKGAQVAEIQTARKAESEILREGTPVESKDSPDV